MIQELVNLLIPMNNKFIVIIVIGLSFFGGCAKKPTEIDEYLGFSCIKFVDADFEELESNLYSYNGKKIKLKGFFNSAFEDFALYSKRGPDRKSGIWLNFHKKLGVYDGNKIEKYLNQEVEVIGIFTLQSKGHLNQFMGELNVQCIRLLP